MRGNLKLALYLAWGFTSSVLSGPHEATLVKKLRPKTVTAQRPHGLEAGSQHPANFFFTSA